MYTVVCGLWFVVCGLWFVVCGLCGVRRSRMEEGQEHAIDI